MNCRLCPRECGVDRKINIGFCKADDNIRVSKTMLHHWEEPCISGKNGSGAIFFSGCTLRCCFCQNEKISTVCDAEIYTIQALADCMLSLQEQGAHNINLVTPSHYADKIIKALDIAKPHLNIPIVYNCGGYEKVETIKMLNGYIDVYMPDIKYYSGDLSMKYSSAIDYFGYASRAVIEMYNQVGQTVLDEGGILQKGLIIRHLILPSMTEDSINILKWIRKNLPHNKILISLMSQYLPMNRASSFEEINRRITSEEYRKVENAMRVLGFEGYTQAPESSDKCYIPDF